MDRETMTLEENYCFDIAGYLILKGVLTRQEVAALNTALDQQSQTHGMLGWPAPHRDPFRDLLVHPVLVRYLNELCGVGFRLEGPPRLIGDTAGDPCGPLTGGNEPRLPSRAYYYQNGRRLCQSVRAIWALEDVNDGGLALIPCSHKANVETPDDVVTGKDDMNLTFQPALAAGDLILVAGELTQGWKGQGRQRLLTYEYAGRAAIQNAGTGSKTLESPYTDRMEELTPEQKAVLYRIGYQSVTPPPVLESDGTTCSLSDSTDRIHPSFYKRDPDSGIDEKEFYFWDLCGHLILRNILTPEELELANEAIDKFSDRIQVGSELSAGSKALAGTGRPTLGGLLYLPKPYCEPFRTMVAHPAIVQRLTWMGGSGFRTGGPTAFCSVKGTSGHSMHGNNEPYVPGRTYTFQNGRASCESITVTWQLRDVNPGDGGFACVPGSHKANYPMPEGVRTCEDHMGLALHQPFKAGDVLFFADGPQIHGTFPWRSEIDRRGILIKYSSAGFHRSGGDLVQPENRWGDMVDGMTDAQLAVMRGPDRDVVGGNVPRLEVEENGDLTVNYNRTRGLYSEQTPAGPVVES